MKWPGVLQALSGLFSKKIRVWLSRHWNGQRMKRKTGGLLFQGSNARHFNHRNMNWTVLKKTSPVNVQISNERKDEWTKKSNKRTNEWMKERTSHWTDKRSNDRKKTNEQLNKRTTEWPNDRTTERPNDRATERMDGRTDEWLND